MRRALETKLVRREQADLRGTDHVFVAREVAGEVWPVQAIEPDVAIASPDNSSEEGRQPCA